MYNNEYKRMKELLKRNYRGDENLKAIKVKCKFCGHTNTIPAYQDSKICHWCNHKVLNDTQVHFTRKILKLMNEMKEGETNERDV